MCGCIYIQLRIAINTNTIYKVKNYNTKIMTFCKIERLYYIIILIDDQGPRYKN